LLGSERAPLPRVEEGRAVALPLDKLGTSYPPGTVDGACVYVFEAPCKGATEGAMVVKNGLAEVV
jgi:hypothetical protein